jgi:hypothetical protein
MGGDFYALGGANVGGGGTGGRKTVTAGSASTGQRPSCSSAGGPRRREAGDHFSFATGL